MDWEHCCLTKQQSAGDAPSMFAVGEGAPDFKPSQHIHYSKSELDYTLDVNKVFDNLYAPEEPVRKKKRKRKK